MKKFNKEKKQKPTSSGEKVRRFPRFGILDLVIILLVICIAVGLAFRYNLFSAFNKLQNLSECAVTFSVKNIESTTQYYIGSGDRVYFKDSGNEFGTIMESSDASSIPLNITPAKETFVENGVSATFNYPPDTRIDAMGRIKCEGKFSSDGTFLLGGTEYIAAGQTFIICTEKVTLEITILGIDPIENQ